MKTFFIIKVYNFQLVWLTKKLETFRKNCLNHFLFIKLEEKIRYLYTNTFNDIPQMLLCQSVYYQAMACWLAYQDCYVYMGLYLAQLLNHHGHVWLRNLLTYKRMSTRMKATHQSFFSSIIPKGCDTWFHVP